MAPTVARDGQYRLFFFSREEPRIHVHVAHPDGEAKFWLTPAVALATYTGLSVRQLHDAQAVSKRTFRRFKMPGTSTSVVEVTHVSKRGFWLLLDTEELLVPFEHFPWFRQATIEQLSDVQWPAPDHLYWSRLDVDLSVQSIRNPAAFPLVSKVVTN